MSSKKDRSQSKSIGLVAMVNVANAVIGISQAYVVGRIFGTQPTIEVYFAASVLYMSMVRLLQAGQISEIFTPIYHQLKLDAGPRVAFDLLSVLLNWMAIISAAFSLLLFFGASTLTAISVPGFPPQRTATCVTMFQLLIPLIGLQFIQAMLSNLLAAEKQFVAQEVVRGVRALIALIVILVFAPIYDAWSMIGSMWVGNLMATAILVFLARRIGFKYYLGLFHKEFQISQIFRRLPSIFGYVGINQLYAIALTAGLSVLPQGSLAVFSYAQKIYSKMAGILIRPVSVVFFNHFSNALAEGDQMIQGLTQKAIKLTLTMATVTSAVVIVAGYPGLKWLWLSEKFPETQVLQTYLALSAFCIIPVFSGLGLIFRKINMSYQFVTAQYLSLMVVQIVCSLMAYFLIPILGLPGAIGVAISVPLLGAIASALLLKIRRPAAFSLYQPQDLLKSGTMFVIAVLPLLLFQHGTDFYQWFPLGRWGHFMAAGVLTVLCGFAILAAAHFLKISEVNNGVLLARKKITARFR